MRSRTPTAVTVHDCHRHERGAQTNRRKKLQGVQAWPPSATLFPLGVGRKFGHLANKITPKLRDDSVGASPAPAPSFPSPSLVLSRYCGAGPGDRFSIPRSPTVCPPWVAHFVVVLGVGCLVLRPGVRRETSTPPWRLSIALGSCSDPADILASRNGASIRAPTGATNDSRGALKRI